MFRNLVKVSCDGCGHHITVITSRKQDAVDKARENGWTSPDWGEHYCPDCGGH